MHGPNLGVVDGRVAAVGAVVSRAVGDEMLGGRRNGIARGQVAALVALDQGTGEHLRQLDVLAQ